MKQVLIKKGQALVEEVPAPLVSENEVLVHVYYSCISAGTEMAGIKSSGMPLYKKALNTLKTQGLLKTIAKVKDRVCPKVT